eukprot:6056630-Amphidinium_carterae.1
MGTVDLLDVSCAGGPQRMIFWNLHTSSSWWRDTLGSSRRENTSQLHECLRPGLKRTDGCQGVYSVCL